MNSRTDRTAAQRAAASAVTLACTVLLLAAVDRPRSAQADGSSYTHVGGAPYALVVDQLSHRVFTTDYRAGTVSSFDGSLEHPVVSVRPVGSRPVALAIDETRRTVFVANADSGTVSRFDADDTDPAMVVASIDSPSAVAVDPLTHLVYVTSSAADRVFWFDGTVDAPELESTPVGSQPAGVAIDDRDRIVAITNLGDGTVSRFAAREPTDLPPAGPPVVTTVAVGGSPSAIAVDPSSHIAVVTDLRGDSVSRFSLGAATPVVSSVPVSRAPASIVIDPLTHDAFVGNALGETVSQFDVTDPEPPVMSIPLGKAPGGVGYDMSLNTVYATNPLDGVVAGRPPLTPEAPSIVSEDPLSPTAGTWFSHAFRASGTPTPALTVSGTLPDGLVFDASNGGLTGTPTTEGTYDISLTAHNLAGPDAVRSYRLVIRQTAPSLAPSQPLPGGVVGRGTSFRFAPAGSAPATCVVSSGRLPAGVVLGASSCALSGRPTVAGPAEFQVTATNSGGSVTATYSLVVAPAGGGTGGCGEGAGVGAGVGTAGVGAASVGTASGVAAGGVAAGRVSVSRAGAGGVGAPEVEGKPSC